LSVQLRNKFGSHPIGETWRSLDPDNLVSVCPAYRQPATKKMSHQLHERETTAAQIIRSVSHTTTGTPAFEGRDSGNGCMCSRLLQCVSQSDKGLLESDIISEGQMSEMGLSHRLTMSGAGWISHRCRPSEIGRIEIFMYKRLTHPWRRSESFQLALCNKHAILYRSSNARNLRANAPLSRVSLINR
jgi:hypothetical protein